MKSEHRHELQTNSLASSVASLPETLKKHSSKILTVLAIALLVVAAIRYKRSQDAMADASVRQSLASAWNGLDMLRNTLRNLEQMRMFLPPEQVKEELQKVLDAAESDVKSSVQSVIDVSDAGSDKPQLASAYAALGQLYWTMSNESPLASTGPATQPTTRPTNYLDLSRDAYLKIVTDYSDQKQPVVAARFALAAIAENKNDWKTARDQYKAIIESTDVMPTDKVMAERRIADVDHFEKPLLLLPASQPVEPPPPTTAPAAGLTELPSFDLGPVTPPSTQPTTAPTTAPTTQP